MDLYLWKSQGQRDDGGERERERQKEKKEKLMSSSACVLFAPQRHLSFINVVFGENLIGFMLLRP